jgi:capsular exopolysaccharide synthesis family protein
MRPLVPVAADPFGGGGGGEGPGVAGLHIAQYLQILRRHAPLILGATALCLAAGAIHFFLTPKSFRSAATILIERRSLLNITGDSNPWLENYWNQEYYPTQYRLLQSRGLAERAARMLEPSIAALAVDGAPANPADDLRIARAAGGLLGGLSVTPIPGTQLVEIAFVSDQPEYAARAANAIAEAYIDWGIESRSSRTLRANELITTQIANTKADLVERERKLQEYSQQADIVSLEPGSNVLQGRLAGLNTAYSDAISERVAKESRYRQLTSASAEALADTLSAGTVGTVRSQLLQKQREYDAGLQKFKAEYPAMVQLKNEIEKLRRDLKGLVEETVRNEREVANTEYQTALRREQGILAQLERAKNENQELNSAAGEYKNLAGEIDALRKQLADLLRQQSDTELTSRMQTSRESNVRIVDRALVPGGSFAPSLRKDLSTGGLLGLLLGIGIVALIEFMDRTIKTTEDVERFLEMPTLAVIPDTGERQGSASYGYGYGYGYAAKSTGARGKAKEDEADFPIELLPHFRPRMVVAEAYRSMRTALLLSSAEELRVVAVTSAQSGEGKTVTASNLAVVMSQLGRQVLLIDGDLRRPRLHEVFKVSNRVGLVSFLTGGAKPEQVFLRSEVPNLWVATSGPIPPNPSELLSSARMRELVALARNSFDFVIIDTPPVLAVTDASILGTLTDGLIVCLRAHKVLQEEAKACASRLRSAELRVLGAVLNRHRDLRSSYYYHRYRSYAPHEELEARSEKTGTAA